MKKHVIGGNFIRKYFPNAGEKETGIVYFPESPQELARAYQEGVLVECEGSTKAFPWSLEKDRAAAYRGFSLQHQGQGEVLDPAEKVARKAARKAARKEMADLINNFTADELRALIASKKAKS